MNFHPSWSTEAKEYFNQVIEAHGGWAAWQKLQQIRFKLNEFRGGLVFVKGVGKTFFKPDEIISFPHRRRIDFVYGTHTDTFENGKLTYSPQKKVIEDGRSIFRKTTFEPWYPEHSTYFFGYAWANYTSYPFILLEHELLGCKIGTNKSVFDIRFPENFHTHCRDQKFFFDKNKMLYCHDYKAPYAGPLVYGAHYTLDYVPVNGVQFALTRKVRPRAGPIVLPLYGIYGKFEI